MAAKKKLETFRAEFTPYGAKKSTVLLLRVGDKVRTDFYEGEEMVVRTITQIYPYKNCDSGANVSMDGGEKCAQCGRTLGKPVLQVSASWVRPVGPEYVPSPHVHTEMQDALAYLRFFIKNWPPFNDGYHALREVLKCLEEGKHKGFASKPVKTKTRKR